MNGTTRRKRFCEGNTELLRLSVSLPHPTPEEEGRCGELCGFYRTLAESCTAFVTENLYPALRAEYEALPPRERKFHPPKSTFSFEVTAQETGAGEITARLSVVLSRGTAVAFERRESHRWALRDGRFVLLPPAKHGREKAKKGEDVR